MQLDVFTVQESEEKCTGLVFRFRVSDYKSIDGAYVHTEKFTLLKRQSCSCNKCLRMLDSLDENYSHGNYPIVEDHLDDKQLCTLIVVNVHKDWESGIEDDHDLQFVPIKQ